MLLNGGQFEGRRYVSEAAVKEMSRKQTAAALKDSYGLGFAVGGDWFGHGGAQATNMEVRPAQGLVIVWMVQHAGFPGEGGKCQEFFRQWALSRFQGGH
jgi:CubicO group peptidase (beta-lactamase class C family)